LARKSNTTTTAMDKSSFFFTANCGVCHPGGAAMQYDRNGKLYYDRNTSTYGYNDAATLPATAQLDGDYGFINPTTGVPTTANWAKTGVTEADCLMCHMTRFATAPGTANHNAGVSWHKRSALLRGFSQAGMAGVANFDSAPTAGAGWASVTYVAGQSPPMGSAATINYGLGITAGTLTTDASGNLQIPAAVIGSSQDGNCRLCHSVPDGKKSGRTLLATTDVHVAKGVGCTRCHEAKNDGALDALGMGKANPHQIGKGDITIGSVRNDLDNTVKDCAACHLGGGDLQAPNPTEKHAAIPGFHFGFMKCQVCHIRHMDDDGLAAPTQDIPELVIEMSSNGTQNVSVWSAYLGTDPLDPSKDLAGWTPPYTSAAGSRPFRWYPAVRWYKGKLTTVKPLYTAWFGEWLSGTGNDASIRPIPLRLVRKALANNYASGSARLASLVLTPGSKVASGAPILHKKAEIKVFLEAMRDAADTSNPDTTQNDIVLRPVLVRAEKVYYLNAAGEVEYFESAVGESHDFAVNHNVVVKRDEANPVVNPGPYGAGGCNDCHGPSSPFFYGKQLHEPAQYDYLDEAGTVPNPDAGKPSYVTHHEMMGYTDLRAGELTGSLVPVIFRVVGAGSGDHPGLDRLHAGRRRPHLLRRRGNAHLRPRQLRVPGHCRPERAGPSASRRVHPDPLLRGHGCGNGRHDRERVPGDLGLLHGLRLHGQRAERRHGRADRDRHGRVRLPGLGDRLHGHRPVHVHHERGQVCPGHVPARHLPPRGDGHRARLGRRRRGLHHLHGGGGHGLQRELRGRGVGLAHGDSLGGQGVQGLDGHCLPGNRSDVHVRTGWCHQRRGDLRGSDLPPRGHAGRGRDGNRRGLGHRLHDGLRHGLHVERDVRLHRDPHRDGRGELGLHGVVGLQPGHRGGMHRADVRGPGRDGDVRALVLPAQRPAEGDGRGDGDGDGGREPHRLHLRDHGLHGERGERGGRGAHRRAQRRLVVRRVGRGLRRDGQLLVQDERREEPLGDVQDALVGGRG
jgi:hypothetical protein